MATGSSAADRTVRIRHVLEEVISRRLAGQAWPDVAVISANPDLLPELREELSELALVEQARQHAEQTATSPGAATIATEVVDAASAAGVADAFVGYEIIREIHRGGQGVVYQAIQKATKRKVAIKVMHEGPFAGPRDRVRFEREVQILATLNHSNIVAVHDSGSSTGGSFYFVMDYISGQPLDAYMKASERPIDETLRLFAKICEAVNAAHLRGVIHRDLKPGNIRVDSSDEPHILDFGLAKVAMGEMTPDAQHPQMMTMTGQFVGSLPWASPEQALGTPDKIDVRTDVYSLGVILYQMLTARFPYEVVGNMRDVLDNILKATPAKPSTIRRQINNEVETIVLKCLQKERERRYQSAGEVARDVQHYLAGEPIEAKRDSALYVIRKSMSRHRREWALAVIVLAVVGTSTVYANNYRREKLAVQRGADEKERQRRELEAARNGARSELDDAHWLLRQPTPENLDLAAKRLEAAKRLDSGNWLPYAALGRLHAIRALRARFDDKPSLAKDALKNFGAALELYDPHSSQFSRSPDDPRLPREFCLAYDLMYLTQPKKYDQELRAAWTPDLGGAADTEAGGDESWDGIYNLKDDDLASRPLSDQSPAELDLKEDTSAELIRVLPAAVPAINVPKPPAYDRYIAELLYDPLFVFDEHMRCIANPNVLKPDSLQPPPEGLTHRLALNPNLIWHDGHPFGAEDVQFTWEQFVQGPGSPLLSVQAFDAQTLELKYARPVAVPGLDLTFIIVPKHVYDGIAAPTEDARKAAFLQKVTHEPVGNGPFRWEPRKPDEPDGVISLLRWERYPGTKLPYVRRVTFLCEPDSQKRVELLASDKVDEMPLLVDEFRWSVNGESFAGVRKMHVDKSAYDFVCWNLANPLFKSVEVRKALAHAVDLTAIREYDFGGILPEFEHLFGKREGGGGYGKVKPIRHDLQEARRLLDRAGWLASGPDWVRMKEGKRFQFTLLVPEEGPWLPPRQIAQQLQQVGVDMAIQPLPFDQVTTLLERHSFAAAIYSVTTNEDPCLDARRFTTSGDRNYGGFSDDEVNTRFELSRKISLPDEKAELFRRIQDVIYEQQPYLFLWEKPALHAFGPRVRGVKLSPLRGPTAFYPGPRDWWVAAQ